ncbi:anti-sigma factor family protein [Rhizobium sp.]
MIMENFKELPLEVRLSAFLDGQVEADDARELEALLASNAEARAIYEQLKAGSAFGNQCFEDMLKEPVPLDIVRSIKAVEAKPAPVRQAANSNTSSFMRFIPQAIAASIMLLFAGGYAGYYVAENRIPGGAMPELVSETSNIEGAQEGAKTRSIGNLTFEAPVETTDSEKAVKPAAASREIGKVDVTLMEVADAHKVYVSDKIHADEVSAVRESELIGYLEAVTSVTFRLPDLSAEGFKLRGGKFVEIVGQPSGALFYDGADGKSVAVYFMKNENVSGSTEKNGYTVIGGQKDAVSYFVAADNADLARKLEPAVSASF